MYAFITAHSTVSEGGVMKLEMLPQGSRTTFFTAAGYGALAVGLGLLSYIAIVGVILMPAYAGSVEEQLAFVASHAPLVGGHYLLLLLIAFVEVLVAVGLVTLTIQRNFACAVWGGAFNLVAVPVRAVGYMILLHALSLAVKGQTTPAEFAALSDLGYTVESAGLMLLSIYLFLFGWALKEGRGLERVVGWAMVAMAGLRLIGGLMLEAGMIGISVPLSLLTAATLIVGPIDGIVSGVTFALLGPMFLKQARSP